jgi:hypothetical protein
MFRTACGTVLFDQNDIQIIYGCSVITKYDNCEI